MELILFMSSLILKGKQKVKYLAKQQNFWVKILT